MKERRTQEERRGEIADAALRIIGRRGITALTVASLAKDIGLTGGALYRHFPSTDAILEAAAARAVARLNEALPDPDIDPLSWLERFIDSRSRAAAGGLMRFILSDQLTMALPKPATALVRAAIASTFASIEQAIVAGQEKGQIRRDIAAADLVPVVVGTVQLMAHAHAGEPLRSAIDPGRLWATLRTMLTTGANAQ